MHEFCRLLGLTERQTRLLGKLVDPAEKSRASIGRRPAQRLLSSACQSLLGRKVQTNCRLRTGTFKLLQCRRRALLLLMSAPCFEHLLLRTTISSCGFAVGSKHSHCAYLPLHSKQPPRSPRRVWNTSLYCIFATTCQEGSFGEWHIYNLLCQQSRLSQKICWQDTIITEGTMGFSTSASTDRVYFSNPCFV